MTINNDIESARSYSEYIQTTYGSGRYQAIVVRYCGARGSGKTLMLAHDASRYLFYGYKVWSNVPIVLTADAIRWAGKHTDKRDVEAACSPSAGLVGRCTLPLDLNALYSLSEDYAQGVR